MRIGTEAFREEHTACYDYSNIRVKKFSAYHSRVAKNHLRDAISAHVVRLLREEREKQQLSMNVLAQRAGLSQGMISLIEHDLRNPTLDTLLRISEALKINLSDILKRAETAARR